MNQNQQNPYSNLSYTFLPPPPPPPPTPTLDTTLTALTHLINLATNTLTITNNFLSSPNFTSCPFNPHHRMPPESLFHHSLKCPSSPGIINPDDLPPLHYPNSLKSQAELRKENHLLFADSTGDLFLSIDGYGDLGANFFYRDCPGVYCSTELDSSKRTFTLPSVLSLHCANFVSSHNNRVDSNGCGILPSDYFNVRREVEGWNCYPCSYSFLVGRVVSGLRMMEEANVVRWIIVNSPRYGVVIDVAMRDHVFVLLRLCLKAISVEACRSTKGEEVSENKLSRFNCPILGEAMSWLESQLSVLYGETNGRLFSVNMLKFCILNAAKSMSSFFLEKEKTQGDASEEVSRKLDGAVSEMGPEVATDIVTGKVKIEIPSDDCATGNSLSASSSDALVYVSQVAAAIAALHERWLLEEKIKGLRLTGSLSKYQRLTECTYVITRAEEERKKRSNYRPILEHDGLLLYRSRNQDSNKNKSKEELLAEERDYKRRRMSYRGKKVKRSLTEVARDIIDEHMEEIKEAGGIGCFVKGSAESEVFPPGPVSVDDVKADRDFKRNSYDTPEPIGGKSHGYSKQSQDQQRRSSHEHYEHLEGQNRSNRKEKRDREYGSKSSDNYGRSHEKPKHRRDLNGMERTRSKYDKRDSVSLNKPKYRDSRSFSSSSNSSIDLSDRRHGQNLESKDRYRERRSRNSRSESLRETIFEDRYDPSESDSRCEDAFNDESSCDNYVKHEKPYRLNNDSSKSKG